MRQNLRTRLLILLLVGVFATTASNLAGGLWGLLRVRNRAISDSDQALENQARDYLLQLAESRASETNQILSAAQQIATTMSDTAANPPPITVQEEVDPLFIASDDRRYQQGATTVIMPRLPEISAINEVTISRPLEQIFPSVARLSNDILRVSYISADGMLRTFPTVVPANVASDWKLETDLALLAGKPEANPTGELVWTDVRRVFAGNEYVISAVHPVYRNNKFIGVIAVDLSLESLTSSLEQIQVGKNGFPAVLNHQGRLIAATETGQRALIGRVVVSREERSALQLDQISPGIAPLLQTISASEPAVVQVELANGRYIMATAPIAGVNWDLVLAYPADEISAITATTGGRIRDIARETQLLNLVISVLLTVTIGALLFYLLRRQLVKPLAALISATESVAAGNLQPIDMPYNDEMGQLARSFNTMTGALSQSQAEILAANQGLEQAVKQRTAELENAMRQAASALAAQQDLVETLNRVSSPVIPVIPGVLAMPLIGQLTEERARFATQNLLRRIETTRVRLVLLDLTGVPVIDPSAAQALRQTVIASRLLGARTMLVGISPDVAQTLIALDEDLSDVATAADLQSAVAQVLRSRANLA